MNLQVGDEIEVTIEKLSFGGSGVARHNSLVHFVPFAAPKDRLRIKVTALKKNFAESEIVEILEPGPSRRKAPCPVAGVCGGCDWQQVTYQEQLFQKNLFLKEHFQKVSKLKEVIIPDIEATKEFNYRNRIQLKAQHGKLGYFARNSHNLVDIDHCPIADEKINEQIQILKVALRKSNQLQRFELALQDDGAVTTVNLKDEDRSLGFSQVNQQQNLKLIAETMRIVEDLSPTSIFDLYCGKGNFSFPLAERFPKIPFSGVDLGLAEIKEAREKAKKGMRFFLSDVGAFLKRAEIEKNSLVVLDPPRAGLASEVCKSIEFLSPQNIVYISCDPTSFSRDVERLEKYKVESVLAVDMFPQTSHIELVAHLKRP
ncbi:MAG: class I SAM-dependent RNA methyltransferase [Pseudobdellovibrionaceae bacterium]